MRERKIGNLFTSVPDQKHSKHHVEKRQNVTEFIKFSH